MGCYSNESNEFDQYSCSTSDQSVCSDDTTTFVLSFDSNEYVLSEKNTELKTLHTQAAYLEVQLKNMKVMMEKYNAIVEKINRRQEYLSEIEREVADTKVELASSMCQIDCLEHQLSKTIDSNENSNHANGDAQREDSTDALRKKADDALNDETNYEYQSGQRTYENRAEKATEVLTKTFQRNKKRKVIQRFIPYRNTLLRKEVHGQILTAVR